MSTRITRKRARLESDVDQAASSARAYNGAENSAPSGGSEGLRSNNSGGDKFQREREDREFWFQDGNVILVAGEVKFRVFKGILSKHSLVFEDMFSLPQPQDPLSDDAPCPVVHLTDSPYDLRHVLRIYMPTGKPSPFGDHHPTFETISASIRLGHKYQFTELVEHSVAYLKRYYPTTFDLWDRNDLYGPPGFQKPHTIGIVNLARLIGEPMLLPSAYLVCCTLNTSIVQGFERDDGSCEQLTLADVGRCFKAKSTLIAERVLAAGRVFEPTVSPECENPAECEAELQWLRGELCDKASARWLGAVGPLLSYVDMCEGVEHELCEECCDMLKQRDAHERRDAWVRLPEMLGIEVEGWDESEKEGEEEGEEGM